MSENYAWLTDTHLDHLSDEKVIAFANAVKATPTAGILWTGDISNGNRLIRHLATVEQAVQRPIYFVLGNHDYYGTQIEYQRKCMRELVTVSPYLKYAPNSSYVMLTTTTALVGHDGWYDAIHGDAKRGTFILTDWSAIHEYIGANNVDDIISISRRLALESVQHVMKGIKEAARYAKNILVITHVPPFKDSCVYRGKPSTADALPWYSSKLMGDMLHDAAKTFPDKTFTVLCGHTHGASVTYPAKNMVVRVGEATYGAPRIQGLIEVV